MQAPHQGYQLTKPVGIFWDIENCAVPRGKSAFGVINQVRRSFILDRGGCREYDFMIACDVTKLRREIQEDVNKAGGVTLAHVLGTSKNAADEKLREGMKKFVDTHGHLTPILVLISGDIDFVNDLRGYQTRLGCYIILLHGSSVSPHFRNGLWNETKAFDAFCNAVDSPAAMPSDGSGLVGPGPGKGLRQKQRGPEGPTQPITNGKFGGANSNGPTQAPTNGKFGGANSTNGPTQAPTNGKFGGANSNNGPTQAPTIGKFGGANSNNGPTQAPTNGKFGGANSANEKKKFPAQGKSNFQPGAGPFPPTGNGVPQNVGPGPQKFKPPQSQEKKGQTGPPTNQTQGDKMNGKGQNNKSYPSQKTFGNHQAPALVGDGFTPGQGQGNFKGHLPPGNYNPTVAKKVGDIRTPRPQTQAAQQGIPQMMTTTTTYSNASAGNKPDDTILMVSGLPGKMDFKLLKEHLQEYAAQVNGRVKYVKNGQGFITFRRVDDAEKAIHLFLGREVYGNKLNIQKVKKIPFETPNPNLKPQPQVQQQTEPVYDNVGTNNNGRGDSAPTFMDTLAAVTAALSELDKEKKAKGQKQDNSVKGECVLQ